MCTHQLTPTGPGGLTSPYWRRPGQSDALAGRGGGGGHQLRAAAAQARLRAPAAQLGRLQLLQHGGLGRRCRARAGGHRQRARKKRGEGAVTECGAPAPPERWSHAPSLAHCRSAAHAQQLEGRVGGVGSWERGRGGGAGAGPHSRVDSPSVDTSEDSVLRRRILIFFSIVA